MDLGAYIKQQRKLKGWSQQDLADRLKSKSTKSFVSQIENGKRKPTFDKLEELANAFDMTINPDLFVELSN
ncbi:MAG TPA: helix-turn-helix transcriptional regulator [Emticicia sp.]